MEFNPLICLALIGIHFHKEEPRTNAHFRTAKLHKCMTTARGFRTLKLHKCITTARGAGRSRFPPTDHAMTANQMQTQIIRATSKEPTLLQQRRTQNQLQVKRGECFRFQFMMAPNHHLCVPKHPGWSRVLPL